MKLNWIKKAFNLNAGIFIEEVVYDYYGKYFTGYIIYQGYILFGIPGYDRLDICPTKESLDETLKAFDIKLEDCVWKFIKNKK